MKKMDFFKMQAQGNDFVFFDLRDEEETEFDWQYAAHHICDCHFGIGADGVILIRSSEEADISMTILNADGSEAKMCGSALRCLCYWYAMKQNKKMVCVETADGIKSGIIDRNDNVVVNLGLPRFIEKEIRQIKGFEGYLVDIGNPHFVIFLDEIKENIASEYGAELEFSPIYPDGINIQFCTVIQKDELWLSIWERGSGTTLACGTGAAAAVYTGIRMGKLESPVTVRMPGGSVSINYDEIGCYLSGPVSYVFSGVIEL
jgi:diaminopimelate epimerase